MKDNLDFMSLQTEFNKQFMGAGFTLRGGQDWCYASPKSSSYGDQVHYELIKRNESFYIEFHVELASWAEGRNNLITRLNKAFPQREFNHSSYYNSHYWRYRNPISALNDIAHDVKQARYFADEAILGQQTVPYSNDKGLPVRLTMKRLGDVQCMKSSEGDGGSLRGLYIPDYQRGYCWKQEDVTGLFSSLLQWYEAVKEKSQPFYMGTIILKEGINNDQKEYAVIDGQQRLLTLAILLSVLSPSSKIGILNCPIGVTSENRSLGSIQALKNAKIALENLIKAQRMMEDNLRKSFFDWLLQSVLVSVIIIGESQSEDLAYTFFSSTNATGKRLSDYDLLKTHHLRYLQTDSAQAKAAECWNTLSQTKCKRKDGTVYGVILTEVLHYSLFRLRHWCRGKVFDPSADTNQNRPIFKHFSVQRDLIALTELPLVPRLDSMLSGGSEFFNYMELYRVKMQAFDQHECVMELMSLLEGHSNGVLWRGIKAMLFMYYCKFGEWHLKEALFCIAYRLSILRNEGRVERRHYNTKGIFSECATVLDQVTLSGEFFAWALARDAMYTPDRSTPTKNRYWDSLNKLLSRLKGSDSTFAIEKQTEEVLCLFSVQTTT